MRDLGSQCGDYRCRDMSRAKDLLRSHTCSIFDTLTDFYSNKLNTWDWEQEIAEEAIQIAFTCWKTFGVLPQADFSFESLRNSIAQHLGHPLRTLGIRQAALIPSVPLPQVPSPKEFAGELSRLLVEARWKPEDIAEKIGIDPRNVYRHLSSETVPTITNIGNYETALTTRLGRTVKLPTPPERQRVSRTSARRH